MERTETDLQLSAVARLSLAIERFNECAHSMPPGYSFSVSVPMEDANRIKKYFTTLSPLMMDSAPFAAGEPFYFKGVRCVATPPKI